MKAGLRQTPVKGGPVSAFTEFTEFNVSAETATLRMHTHVTRPTTRPPHPPHAVAHCTPRCESPRWPRRELSPRHLQLLGSSPCPRSESPSEPSLAGPASLHASIIGRKEQSQHDQPQHA